MVTFALGFLAGVVASVIYSVLKPAKWAKAQNEVKIDLPKS